MKKVTSVTTNFRTFIALPHPTVNRSAKHIYANNAFTEWERSATDCSPFGVGLYGRSWSEGYRFGFNGMERDDEIKGEGNSWNFKYRMHDPRLGKFFAVDPMYKSFAHNSTYAFSENSTVGFMELEGLEKISVHSNSFVPFDTFGGGFTGDGANRKFGDPLNFQKRSENFRIGGYVMLDLANSQIVKKITYETTSQWIEMKNPFFFGTISLVQATSPTNFPEDVTFEDDELFFQLQGNDDALLWGFNPGFIDVKVKVSFEKVENQPNSWLVTGETHGDRFPANETYLTDESGAVLFLGVSGVDNNNWYGPQMELLGTAFEDMSEFKFIVHMNEKNIFTGVTLCDDKWTYYSIDEWNKIFTSLDPTNTSHGTSVSQDGVNTNYDPD